MTSLEQIANEMYGNQANHTAKQGMKDFTELTGFDNEAYSFYNRSQLNEAQTLIALGVKQGKPELIEKARKIIADTLQIDIQEIARYSPEQLLTYISSVEGKAHDIKEFAFDLLETKGYKNKILNQYNSALEDDYKKVDKKLKETREKYEKELKMNGLSGKSLEDRLKEYDKEAKSRESIEKGNVLAEYIANLPIDEHLEGYDNVKRYHEGIQLLDELMNKYSDEQGNIKLNRNSLELYKKILQKETDKETEINDAIVRAKIYGLNTEILGMHQRVLFKQLYDNIKGNVTNYIKDNIHSGVDQYGSLVNTIYQKKQEAKKEKQSNLGYIKGGKAA